MKMLQKIKEWNLHMPWFHGKKKIYLMAGVGMILAAGVIGGVVFWVNNRQLKNYKVITQKELEETTVTAEYEELGDYILKYGGDEVVLLNSQGGEVWNVPQSLEHPTADLAGEYCVVYDKKGSDIAVYDLNGKVTDIQTNLPIEKVCVNQQGLTAAILADGETTWIHVYDQTGEILVTAKTSVDNPGYPVDLSLSDNGQLMAVAYLCVKNSQPSSFMGFYNFGNTGQNQMDNQVSGYNYVGTLIPQVDYLEEDQVLAFTDEGFVSYEGKQIPEEQNKVSVTEDIVSVFFDDEYAGIVYRGDGENNLYEASVYDISGTEKCKIGIDFTFDHIALSKKQILVYNEKEIGIYTLRGDCRYRGTIKEGRVEKVFRISGDRYMVVLDSGTETIRLR